MTMPKSGIEHTLPFSSLLRQIVMQNSAAVEELRNIIGTMIAEIKHGGFLYFKGKDSSDSCNCWYELEYFDFIRGKTVVAEILDRVCENLDCGKCKHVLECEKENVDNEECYSLCSTTLTNAAAASGNKQVLKFLASRKEWLHNRPLRTGIWPINVAVIKGQHRVIKYLYTDLPAMKTVYDMFTADIRVYNRANLVTGLSNKQPMLEEFDRCYNIVACVAGFLCVHNITNIKILTNLIENLYFDSNATLGFLLTRLLICHSSDVLTALLSVEALKTKKFKVSQPAKMMSIGCILSDDETFLRALISAKFDISFRQCGYNLLDIATAVGSEKCATVLQSYMKNTENVFKKVSPFNALQFLERDFPDGICLTSFLPKCANQGFSVNEIDASGQAPVHQALRSRRPQMVRALLELGADINMICFDKTPIHVLLSVSDWHEVWKFDLLKTILYHNPMPDMNTDVLLNALQFDLDTRVPGALQSKTDILFIQHIENSVENGIVAESMENRFLALSAFALLWELGFSFKDPWKKYLQQDLSFMTEMIQSWKATTLQNGADHTVKDFLELVVNVTSQPRSLQSSCRIAIRRAHPGGRLHRYVAGLTLPMSIKTFIVHPYILWKTVVKCEPVQCHD